MTEKVHAQARTYVQARLDGRLAPEQQAWLNAHLAACAACRAYAAELAALERLLPETLHARWEPPARRAAVPNPGAYLPRGAPRMSTRQKLFNYAGLGLGLGALAVLLIGFALALQTFTLTDSQVPGQELEATSAGPIFTPPPMMVGTFVRFGEALALEGYSVRPGEAEGEVLVELVWHALETPPADYMVGVFVMPDGAQSAILSQSDSVPAGGTRPTSGWQPGEYVKDAHTLLVVTELDRVDLVLWVNVYDPNTGERLTSDPPGGGPFNAVSIGLVSLPAGYPPTATALPFTPGETTPEPYPAGPCSAAGDTAGPCTPTATPCTVACDGSAEAAATEAMAATLGWTATPIGFVASPTPCQVGCDDLWATQTAIATLGTPTPMPTPDLSATPAGSVIHYTVREGDTLQGIAAFYGVPVDVIVLANDLNDPVSLSVGQVLIIPLAPQPTAVDVTPTSTPSP